MLKIRKGQSIAEYAVLLSLVIAAAVGMQIYVKRGIQAKIKSGTDAFSDAGAGTVITVEGKSATLKALSQYEPYYQESQYERYQENIEQEYLGEGKIAKEKVSDISATKAGGYDKQATARDKATREEAWK